jgi:FkbM family methyltransferase
MEKIFRFLFLLRALLVNGFFINKVYFKIPLFYVNKFLIQASNSERYEPELVALYGRELHADGGFFLDVGANYGQTLLAVISVNTEIPYVGIEPQASCASSLVSFIKSNGLNKHQIICAGISDQQRIINLGFSYEGDVRASIIPDFRPKNHFDEMMAIPVVTGDQLVEELNLGKVQFIKIDVEGAELEVIRSFEKVIARDKPTMTFEILPHVLVSSGESLPTDVIETRIMREQKISEYLSSIGYQWKLLSGEYEIESAIEADNNGQPRNYVARSY